MIATVLMPILHLAAWWDSGVTKLMKDAFSGGLDIASSWVMAGAAAALLEVAHTIGLVTTPNLASSAFAATYLRVSALAVMLTLPFLFAAMAQAMLRGDFALLVRAVAINLPVALIGMSLAVPLVQLLLSVTDWMCTYVAGAGANGGAQFLARVARDCVAIGALTGSNFLLCLLAMLTVLAALALTVELLIREAAVYVVVLMTPLAFAAMVWPARRVWVLRTLELLLALILSKFVIVAVLALAGAMVSNGGGTGVQLISALALLALACFAPWALVRLIPFSEGAAHTADSVHQGQTTVTGKAKDATTRATGHSEAIPALLARLGSVPTDFAGADTATDTAAAAGGHTSGQDSSLGSPIAAVDAPGRDLDPSPTGKTGEGAAVGTGDNGGGSGVALDPSDSLSVGSASAAIADGTGSSASSGADADQALTPEPRFQSDLDYDFSAGTRLRTDGADVDGKVDAFDAYVGEPTYAQALDGIGADTTLLKAGPRDLAGTDAGTDGGPTEHGR